MRYLLSLLILDLNPTSNLPQLRTVLIGAIGPWYKTRSLENSTWVAVTAPGSTIGC